jgi:hypothetical protein
MKTAEDRFVESANVITEALHAATPGELRRKGLYAVFSNIEDGRPLPDHLHVEPCSDRSVGIYGCWGECKYPNLPLVPGVKR